MSFNGDWAGLRRIIDGIEDFADNALDVATAEAEKGVIEQYQADFAAQHSPIDGAAWPATKAGKSPVLLGPSLELSSPTVTSSNGVVRVLPVYYFIFQQWGANGITPRPVLPYSETSIWDKPIQIAIEYEVFKLIPKG